MKARIQTFDVWGNALDGFEINQTYSYGTYEIDADFPSKQAALDFLNEHYFSEPQSLETVDVAFDGEGLVFLSDAYGEPLCQILIDTE